MFFVLRGSILLLVSSFTPIGCCLITACTKTTCTFQEFTLRHDFIKMLSKDEKKFEISIHSPYDIATDFTEISAGNRYLMCADCRQEQTRNKPHAVHTYPYRANYRIQPPPQFKVPLPRIAKPSGDVPGSPGHGLRKAEMPITGGDVRILPCCFALDFSHNF